MAPLHPHWQTTDEGEQPVAIRVTEHAKNIPTAKRSPAALVGIALFLVAGFFAFGGRSLLPAQTTLPGIAVTITDTTMDPPRITVHAGDRITWTNSSGIPHILFSDTLKNADGTPFETTAIFPNSQLSYDIPANTPAGTYDIQSRTSTITGTIEVVAMGQGAMSSAASSMSSATSSAVPLPPVIPAPVSSTSSSSMADSVDGSIPENPYTVGNANAGTVTTQSPAVTTHKPTSQPASGMGVWVAVTVAILALLIVVRRAGRSHA